jgi:hypothetical protein
VFFTDQECGIQLVVEGARAGFPGGCHDRGLSWADIPVEVQQHILGFVPLADLARAAAVCKGMRAAYRERLQEREACIQLSSEEGWPPEVTEGLSPAHMALPRDLVVTPPVGPLVDWDLVALQGNEFGILAA